jgi:hypothetical protein
MVGVLIVLGVLTTISLLLAMLRVVNRLILGAFNQLWHLHPVFGVVFAAAGCVFVSALLVLAGGYFWENRRAVLAYWRPRLRQQSMPYGPAVLETEAPPSPSSSRAVFIGTGGLVVALALVALLGGSVAANAIGDPGSESAILASQPISTMGTTPHPTAPPTASPTLAPAATAIPPTATTAPCTTLNCNPWGYSFTGSTLIYDPPGAFCSYFDCIANFWNGNGYVVECADDRYSKSGGIQGACSQHGGVLRPLYAP